MSNDIQKNKGRGSIKGALTGLAVIAFGVLWLLSKMGVVALAPFWHYWPSVIILVGLCNLLQRGQGIAHRIFALLLMGFGTAVQLHYLGWLHLSWEYVWPSAIIAVGAWIILTSLLSKGRGKRRCGKAKGRPEIPENVVVFGGRDERITSEGWEGGDATAIFGGFDIDLRHAEMQGDEVEFQATAIFGGVELRIPDHWIVEIKGSPVIGSFEDKTRLAHTEPGAPPKKLILSGVAIFGGVEVKN